jgi:hypothetical protein
VVLVRQTNTLTVDGDASIAQDGGFQSGYKKTVAGYYGVAESAVDAEFSGRNVRRRLQAAPGRRLAAIITIDTVVTVASEEDAQKVADKMANSAALADAIKAGGSDMGVTVTGVSSTQPVQTVAYIQEDPGAGGEAGTGGTGGTGTAKAAEEEGGNTGVIIGAIVGAIGGLAILGAAFFFYSKKTSSQE